MGSTAISDLAITLDMVTGYSTFNYIVSAPGVSSQAISFGPFWTSKALQLQLSTLVIWTTGLETPYASIHHLIASCSNSSATVLLLHNHDNVHWGLSITLRKANHHHVLCADSLNNRYPVLEEDLTHFWTRSTRAAHALQLAPDSPARITMHHLQLQTQTNNYDCGLFVLAYQRATQH